MGKIDIAVVAGGDSSEYIVSLKSSANVFNVLDRNKFNPWLILMKGDEWKLMKDDQPVADINKGDFSFVFEGKTIRPAFAYIMIHGTPGENGILQGYFDLLGIPYSTCGVASSALTFNKFFCNNYLRNFGIPMAESVRLVEGDSIDTKTIVGKLGLPIFVKPNAGGSSFGITKVKSESELEEAVRKAWTESKEAILESFLEGAEFTSGLVKLGSREIIFPVTEVLPKNEFFDFEAKYNAEKATEITPARISEELTRKVQQLSSKIYDLCNCRGIVRVDYILKDGVFYFLEVNTTPGMTATSFIPQQIRAMGLELKDVLSAIIEDGLQK
ncbi:MAG: D-alanine--D-alanine ligase [Bacteroidota bacterium]|nr:D-alanine--D-alanine ligase [Bacteroidota bacterium]MDP4205463.1 D-alanine--D-alanine ligase [Bacteroidota bacterium]